MKNLKTEWFSRKAVSQLMFVAFFMVPLKDQSRWKKYQFMNAQPNQYQFTDKGLLITVDNSASPFIYPFKEPQKVKQLIVRAELIGSVPTMSENMRQGIKNYDDFLLRVGVVYQGENRLNWLQRQLAPTWLVEMEKLLPNDKGIGKVMFYTTCVQKNILNKVRKHMLNSKLIEECVAHIEKPGDFVIKKNLSDPTPILGLWIASDADEMGHNFKILIKQLKIQFDPVLESN